MSAKFEGFTTEEELESATIRVLGSVRGLVTNVSPESLLQTHSFTILTSGGLSLKFVVDQDSDMGNFISSHLRQHGVAGEPVTVFFRDTPQGLVVERIMD